MHDKDRFVLTRPSKTPSIKEDNVPPGVWLVIGSKVGDNTQAQTLVDALGWPYERKQFYFREPYAPGSGKPRFKPSLYHVDMERSDILAPPWPDLIITVGRRPSMVAMWICEQSGGHTKVVVLGRPRRLLDRFDLVIATAQFRLPKRPNVLNIGLPFIRMDTNAIVAAAKLWKPRFDTLPRPLIALLVGGQTSPFLFNARVAKQLIERTGREVTKAGGTLYITTSRRTPPQVVEILRSRLPANALLHEWTDGNIENPYLALLGLADCFIVTGDSVSMMTEVAQFGKPLAIFPLPYRFAGLARLGPLFMKLLHPPSGDGGRGGLLQPLGDVLYRLGWVGYSRDLTAIHRLLIQGGIAVRLGAAGLSTKRNPPPPDKLQCAVERVKTLMEPMKRQAH